MRACVWSVAPTRELAEIDRTPLAQFPRDIGPWSAVGEPAVLAANVERTLGADDYLSLAYVDGGGAPVSFFSAWYADQTKGGIHSPEVCLPGGGWEMQSITVIDIAEALNVEGSFPINRAVIQKGQSRLMVYYWFDQSGRRIAGDYIAKAMLVWSGLTEGRTDGALVRLTTPILPGEPEGAAEGRIRSFLSPALESLPRFVTGVRKEG